MPRPHLDYAGPSRFARRRLFQAGRRNATLIIAGVVLLTVATAIALVLWVMHASAVPRSALARLQAGMNAQQVTQLLGRPDTRDVAPDGAETWTYSRMTWAYLTIDFDAQQTVTAFNHDE